MGVMTLRYSDADGQHTVHLDRVSTSIGRSAGQDVVLQDPSISRHHAVILREADSYTIVDQNSTHGTFLNSVRVERAVLTPEDVLQMGSLNGTRLRLHIGRADASAASISRPHISDLLSSFSESRLTAEEHPPEAREMEQLNWLLRAARKLNEGGAIEDILGALLQLTLQLTGVERGFVFLREDGAMHLARGLGADGIVVEEDSTVSHKAIERALESEAKFSISDTLKDNYASEWSSVLANRIRSVYCIPLRKRVSAKEPSELLGLLYLDSQIRAGAMTKVDHQLLDTIATEASALLHNALLAESEYRARQEREELAVAARIHGSLMSYSLPKLPYAMLEAKSVPCLAIGGDFYDVVVRKDCVCVTLADVSGKGVSAAIVAATLQGVIHAQMLAGHSLPEIASQVNEFLCTRNVGKYATMVMLKLFPDGSVEYINCGHIQPISILGNAIRRLEESNLIVGLIQSASYTSAHCKLQPGERILLVTDGVTEAEDKVGEPLGNAGLDALVPYDQLDDILGHISRYQAPNLAQDDCTLVEIRYTAKPL